jgi:hypothetical protein
MLPMSLLLGVAACPLVPPEGWARERTLGSGGVRETEGVKTPEFVLTEELCVTGSSEFRSMDGITLSWKEGRALVFLLILRGP